MAKGRIAILEDDSTLANAMKAAFERVGYEVFASSRIEEIEEYLQKSPVNTLFVDCLLPGGSGVDFSLQIRKTFPAEILDIVMMSGLFTDSGFMKETVRSVQAISFLKKPFELDEALKTIRVNEAVALADVELSPRRALYLLFNKPKVSVREKRKAIEALEEIHGFDLPYLFSLMVETQATGHLNIVGSKGEVSGISFSEGKIVAVDIVDKETQLGKLLIEAGFIIPEDLNQALLAQSSKRLGERLIQGNLLSPHAFNIALANQMSIRLSRTITDGPIKVNFVGTDVKLTYPHIDSEALSGFLHDWVASKISPDWLKAHYTLWGNYSLARSINYAPDHPILQMPLISHFVGFVDYFTKGLSLHQLMDGKKFPEETAYKALHLLLAKGLLIFDEQVIVQNADERIQTLKKISMQLKGKNKLDTWDLMSRMAGGSGTSQGPLKIYEEFEKILGPKPEGADAKNKELMQLHTLLKKISAEAYQFSENGNRDQMIDQMEREALQGKLRAASLFEEAKQALHRSQFVQAAGLLKQARALDPHLEKMKIYQIWSKLGQVESRSVKTQALLEVEMELMEVPPEEKFDALYSFIMGLFFKAKGDSVGAKKLFEKAYNIDNQLLVARREIASLASIKNQKKDVLNRDLKDLVSGFFKKK